MTSQRTHVWQQMKEGIAAQCAHCQGHKKGEQELEAGLVEDGHEHHTQQGQQADDGDGYEAPHPYPHWGKGDRQTLLNPRVSLRFINGRQGAAVISETTIQEEDTGSNPYLGNHLPC